MNNQTLKRTHVFEQIYLNFFPDPPSIQPFIDLTIIEGITQVITCNITEGNPQNLTKVYWTGAGHGTVQSGQNLTLRFLRSHNGTYICHAQNTYEDGTQGEATQSVKIDVECKYTNKT